MSEFTHRLPHQPWSKPSRNEEEYFHRDEFRHRMEVARQRETDRAAAERERWLESHRDRCPKCGGHLQLVETDHARADQCPKCLGVWLDHETFDQLTHPHQKNAYLTMVFRDILLQFTTGKVNPTGGEDH
jgi:hypothetical protein